MIRARASMRILYARIALSAVLFAMLLALGTFHAGAASGDRAPTLGHASRRGPGV